MALHHLQEFDDDLAARADEDLALATLLGVVDGIERIVEDGGLNHDGGVCGREILKALKMRLEVSAWAKMSASRSHLSAKECPSVPARAWKGSSAHVLVAC